MNKLRADYHVHTAFSDDSDYPMEEALRRGIAIGLEEICFTDHVDYGVKSVTNCDYPAYCEELFRCREAYSGQITVKLGIEFGIQVHTMDAYKSDFAAYPFDFVLFSCHQVDDKEFWNQDYQQGKSQREYNENYYLEILRVLEAGYEDYSVLAHLDMLRRYDQAGHYPFAKVKDIVAAILEKVIAQGKGIELNTSSERYKIGDLTPGREIWKLYQDLGGEILSIGSDAHREKQLGMWIEEGKEELKALGFDRFCTFEKMQPVFHAL